MPPAPWPPPTGCAARPGGPASTSSTRWWTTCWRALVPGSPPFADRTHTPKRPSTRRRPQMNRSATTGTATRESGRPAARPLLRGALTALVTPFTETGDVDEAAFRQLVRWQILAGIDGLVPCGTTGESPTLSADERDRLIAITVETVSERPSRARLTVVAGTGTNDTMATIRATRRAATNVSADTFLPRAEHPRIVAVKEASGNLDQIALICRDRPAAVAVLAGDDAWTLPIMAMGGDGVVSVASNEIPGEMVALCAAARSGDLDGARRIHERWLTLFQANFQGGPNPVPAKAALALMGLIASDAVRAPLLPLDGPDRERLAATLRTLGLVEQPSGRIAGHARMAMEPAASRESVA